MKFILYGFLSLLACGCATSKIGSASGIEDKLFWQLTQLFAEEGRVASRIDIATISARDWHYEMMLRDEMREESAKKILPLLDQLHKESRSCSDYRVKVQRIAMKSGVSEGFTWALSDQSKCNNFEFLPAGGGEDPKYRYSQQFIQRVIMSKPLNEMRAELRKRKM
jgi:hypothetical protein